MFKLFGIEIGTNDGWDPIDEETHVFYKIKVSKNLEDIIPDEHKSEEYAFITVSYTEGEIYFNKDIEGEKPDFTLRVEQKFNFVG